MAIEPCQKFSAGQWIETPLRTSEGALHAYSMHWSPDGERLAANVDTYPATVFIYDTAKWKPVAEWRCGEIGQSSEFVFQQRTLLQVTGGEINALEVR